MTNEFDFNSIIKAFGIENEIEGVNPITDGNINRTYKVTAGGKNYLLQLINTFVFKNPDELMSNISRVTGFLAEKIKARGGDVSRETLTFLPCTDGKLYYKDENDRCWRLCNFVENSHSYNYLDSPVTYKKAGVAFGNFTNELADFPGDTLFETIPDFHNTAKRFEALKTAIEENMAGRREEVLPEIEWALSKEDDARKVVDLIANGELPIRVTHNDTKLNNILFDDATDNPICVIDLDTIMPGVSLYDFGDSIRYAANTAEEDEKDLSKVDIDFDLYRAYLEGFIESVGTKLTAAEVENLPFSAKLMSYECGIRFLTDYLNGDTYFKTLYPTHNLDRCRCQFELVRAIERNYDELLKITYETYGK